MNKRKFTYGEKLEIYTFTGWEDFDWDSLAFETTEDAFKVLREMPRQHIRTKGCPAPRAETPPNHRPVA